MAIRFADGLFYFRGMETAYPKNNAIKFWAEDDRPREKLQNQGRQYLSDSELLAILLGSGTRQLSAVDLARSILDAYEGDLNKLARAGIKDLMKFPGVGVVKAVSLIAAFEMGARRKSTVDPGTCVGSSQAAYEILAPKMKDLLHEEFWVLLLAKSHKLLKIWQVSKGGMTSTVVDPRMIFKQALDIGASSIILAHNHPSHSLKPSDADLQLTKKMVSAGKVLDIHVIDHLIITQTKYMSFIDEGLMP